MNFYIIPVLFCNTMDTLFGVENDVIIIYNLFYKFHLKSSKIWQKPYFFINQESILSNIKDILINLNYNINTKIIFIIYFSGHSNSKGHLKFYNNNISSSFLLNYINTYLKCSCQIYFIIDTCHSKNFTNNLILNISKYNFIEKIYFMGSCMENELSKEIETEFDKKLFRHKKINFCKKFIVGIFTLYLVILIKTRKISNLIDFKNIINDKLWKMISNKYKQTIYYEEFNNY
jgi:hypothetical protein